VVGGAGGVGVLMNSPTNVLNNSGQISTADGATGMAVQATAGDTTISNGGQLQGSMQLAAGGNNLLHNLAGGTIFAGASLDLGGTGVLSNDGVLTSASAALGAMQINGALTQSSTGVLQVRMDAGSGAADTFSVSGAAQLAGKLQPVSVNLGQIVAGAHVVDLISAGGGVSLSGLTLDSQASAIQTYSLTTSGNTLRLGSLVDFAPAGLSGSAAALAPIITAVQAQGGSPLFALMLPKLVAIPSVAGLDRAYQNVAGAGASAAPQATFQATSLMLDAVTNQMDAWRIGMLSAQDGSTRAPLVAHQGKMGHGNVWFAPIANSGAGQGGRNQLYGGTLGVDETLDTLPIPVLVGGAVSASDSFYSDAALGTHGRVSDAGVHLYGVGQIGRGYISASGFAGAGHTGMNRNLYGLGLDLNSAASLSTNNVAARFEGGYSFDAGLANAHLTPFVAVQPMHLWQSATRENFANLGSGLHYDAASISALPSYLGAQFDQTWKGEDGQSVVSSLRLAWMHDFMPSRNVSRSFAELPSFALSGTDLPITRDAAVAHAGLSFTLSSRLSFIGSLDMKLAGGYRELGGTGAFRFSW